LQNGSPTEAISELNQALTLSPDYVDAILLLGEADLRASDVQPVTVSMQQLLNKHPNLLPGRVLLADAYTSLGQLDDAARTFRDQIRVSPRSGRPYMGLGLTCVNREKFLKLGAHLKERKSWSRKTLRPLSNSWSWTS
jgi:cytochrome c-type biogenesis protein CcmH/NrfG